MAMNDKDGVVQISNRGDSMDQVVSSASAPGTDLIRTRSVSIGTLRKEHPELEGVGFVKIDTEGYERVIVPALRDFFIEKRPVALVSLHPMFISHSDVQGVVDVLKSTFPYLYEVDMRTPFLTNRTAYTYGDHGGADVLCTWEPVDRLLL
mmetsp:Transcript_148528/g.475469  ORF Transcript_148528/g.475469 Transcript_148528/m.475469 type:complete len:150 (-) Transcript_148528:573-1022(-)